MICRHHRRFALAIATAFCCLVALPGIAEADEDYTPFRIYAGVGFQQYPGGGASRFQATVRYRFHEHWYVDAVGMTGGVHRAFDPTWSDPLYNAIAIGPGFSNGEQQHGWEWRVSLRGTHVHHAPAQSWRENFWANLIADDSGDVRHRSGAELAAGVTGPRAGDLWDRQLIWSSDVVLSLLPTSEPMFFGAGLVFSFSIGSK